MCGSRAEVHNVVSLVTMDVAPGVCRNRSISAAAQHGDYSAGQNVYLPVFCFEGLISEFPKFTYRFPSLRASFSSQVKKNRKPD